MDNDIVETDEPWPGFDAELVAREQRLIELWAPFGKKMLTELAVACRFDRLVYYTYMYGVIDVPPDERRAFLLLFAAESAGQKVTGAA